jgi:predicted nucleotidyltransferase component of viral defense system
MASLGSPFWNMVTPEMRQLLIHIGQESFSHRFYLAGGTALSIQIGHRRSVDFDFFSETDEIDESSRKEIIIGLSSHSVEVIESVQGNLLTLVDGIRIGFFSYGYPLVDDLVNYEKIAFASLIDIGLMKCDALISRGSRKDFYDLFYITRSFQFDRLFQFGEKKYRHFRDFPLMVLESMTLFDNADRDIQPELFENIPWDQVKQFFVEQASLLSSQWFE